VLAGIAILARAVVIEAGFIEMWPLPTAWWSA
jgi:hypothetical protein